MVPRPTLRSLEGYDSSGTAGGTGDNGRQNGRSDAPANPRSNGRTTETIDAATASTVRGTGTRNGSALRNRLIGTLSGPFSGPGRDGDMPRVAPRDEQPLRGDLYSVDQLVQHAKTLSGWHQTDTSAAREDRLLSRLDENEAVLEEAYDLVVDAAEKGRRISPAAEWLIDNFYLIQEQVRLARRHLPKGYAKELPRLRTGPSAGRPRVYDLVLELISHGDGRVDDIALARFMAAYQQSQPLKLGELWAVPIMLRLALIENLRRVSARIAASQADQDLAHRWSGKILKAARRDPKSVVRVLADMYDALQQEHADEQAALAEAAGEGAAAPTEVGQVQLSSAFVSEFARRLQGHGAASAFPLEWLTQALSEQGQTVDGLVQIESQRQAADQVSIGNSIGSLRFIEATDWSEFVESMSVVENALRGDPADVYSVQDFVTRDHYRHVVEQIAKRSPYTEQRVAEVALQIAREAEKVGRHPNVPREAHVGHALIDEARPELEKTAGMRHTAGQSARRLLRGAPLACFLGAVLLVTALLVGGVLGWSAHTGMRWWAVLLLAVPTTIAASQVAIGLVNWLITVLAAPRPLPRLDFERGIPQNARTMVVVPAMLTSKAGIDQLIQGIEIRYLANPDENLHFALLSDFGDHDEETKPGDDELVEYAATQIETLALRHGQDADRFLFLHRPRRWNESEGVWMGWERKRGKLTEFNALLRPCDATDSPSKKFSTIVGPREMLFSVHYVITLDADTELPRDAARKLVGTMAHPLNRPVWDDNKQRVVQGYGILQPRVGIDLPSSGKSVFSQLTSGDPGVDPYTRAVSDVYQDAFGEGSFIGKGIYDPEIFEKACGERFAENRILSHDLIESAFARSGLVSDVTLYEDQPSRYLADVARRHRWMRGDWQIASFVFGGQGPSALSRWKILDNLRRSLVPPAVLLTLVLAWTLRPSGAWAWSLLALGYYFGPALCVFVTGLTRKSGELPWSSHVAALTDSLKRDLGRAAMNLIFLPYEAFKSVDAVTRTLWRMTVSGRRLLEWTTSADAQRRAQAGGDALRTYVETMWPGVLIAIGVLFLVLGAKPIASVLILPIAALWILSPAAAWLISKDLPSTAATVLGRDRHFLSKLSRRTWSFFDQYVGEVDHYLPPDNYQESPAEQVAHRTSPTNIGLALLSNLAAWDFGYITLGTFLDRTLRTLQTCGRLEKHESGQLYNWYDTKTLAPLTPRYVSAVDSGNFIASLHTLRGGLDELADGPVLGKQVWAGLEAVIRLLLDAAGGREHVARPDGEGGDYTTTLPRLKLGELQGELERLRNDLAAGGPSKLGGAKLTLQRASIAASDAVKLTRNKGNDEAHRWALAFEKQAARFAEELHHLAPWVDLVGPAKPYHGTDHASKSRLALLDRTLAELEDYPSLHQVAALKDEVLPAVEAIVEEVEAATLRPHVDLPYFQRVHRILRDAAQRSRDRITALRNLRDLTDPFLQARWDDLYDADRDLLHIGFNCAERRPDSGYYDLLASEMRLGSFVLVATGVVPQDHWFSLGRQITTSGSYSALLSWSGSMFEYLMPLLMMPTYAGTLLDQTYRGVLNRQQEYAKGNGIRAGVPWGVSESGYNATDANLTYQYRPFGVPGLGYKRGLGEDLVIAPYASIMGVMVDPSASVANLRRLRREGQMGRYGFYEAVDYTPSRIKRGDTYATVHSYMVHHQAMGFLAMAYTLLGQPMQRRLLRQPAFKSAELLLHEKVPMAKPVYPHAGEHAGSQRVIATQSAGTLRVFRRPDTPTPEVHLLANGRFTVMVTAAGGGFTRWHDEGTTLSVTRWHEDATRDHWGTFVYLRDVETGKFWSNTWQPTSTEPDRYEAIFSQARAEYRRVDKLPRPKTGDESSATGDDGEISCHTEISVSPEDDVEVRRLTVTNNSRRARTIELTSYSEAVLADPKADAAHPAFQNLFVQTRLIRGRQAILATRRPRSEDETTPHLVHLMAVYGTEVGDAQYETDRSAFVGRGRTLEDPAAMHSQSLGDSSGSVLDPIVSVRRSIRLEPGEACKIDVVTGVATTNEAAHALIEKYHDRRLNDRVAELAWTQAQVVLRQLNLEEIDAQMFGRLAGSILYATPQRRASADVIAANTRHQNNLWAYGISGDIPIMLVRVSDIDRAELVEEAVQCHAYWRRKGLVCDLVFLNEDTSGYRQEMHDAILAAVSSAGEQSLIDQNGGIFIRRAEQFSEEDRILLMTVARVILNDKAGSLADQIDRRAAGEPAVPKLVPIAAPRGRRETPTAAEIEERDLIFQNGLGGFTPDGKEYVITTTHQQPTPAPWCNVMANPDFGTIVSESGVGYTWQLNAREFRLTPWYNDPVSDTSGECFYIRDEESGAFWSPTPLPARGTMPYTTRHGFGYSVFEYAQDGIDTETTIFVHRDEPAKFWLVKIRNTTDRRRRISLSGFVEWVMTDQRSTGAMHTVTSTDPQSGAVFAQNKYNAEFGNFVGVFNVSENTTTVTGDRVEFLGRAGSAKQPAAMGRTKLSGKVGAGLDPCAAIRTPLDLGPGEEREVVFMLGAGRDAGHARAMALRFANVAEVRRSLEANWAYWGRTLGTLYVQTPDPAVNVLVNGWLEYQVLSCRYWGRSGFYQSGGAYGFRDQLQDVAALLWSAPETIREHILRASAYQFDRGDVLHWWHPVPNNPVGKGVRTHFSDDYMWLPLITARYVSATGDTGLLDEDVPFLTGQDVPPEQESLYMEFHHATEQGSVYEHAKRAVLYGIDDRGLGRNGLPLIGCGDWNDGMNLIGEHGEGESVWLAWFFIVALTDFAKIADGRGDDEFARKCRAFAETLRENVEANAWDGEWYRRAYFDDGRPLGSSQNPECQIDSLPQSWSILSGVAQPDRSASAMQHVDERLVRRGDGLIQLFDPPFDNSDLQPGYIKGYVPGVRENGGQYTHAAIWTVMAFAEMGDAKRAWELFDLINPVNHAANEADMMKYKVEPYVVAADVYGVEPHTGRGGWTWYTGSAGWMLRLLSESLLGLKRVFEDGEHRLYLTPKLPAGWDTFEFTYRHAETYHHVTVHHAPPGDAVTKIVVDGEEIDRGFIPLDESGGIREIEVYVGPAAQIEA